MGRPLKDIDGDQVYRLAKVGCTQEDIAEFFSCASSVISERFREEYHLGRAASRITLRHLQFKRARAGSDKMLIHLGQQYLGQAEKAEVKQTGEPSVVILPANGRE